MPVEVEEHVHEIDLQIFHRPYYTRVRMLFFRRSCADLPEDDGSIGEGLPPVNDKRIKCLHLSDPTCKLPRILRWNPYGMEDDAYRF
jgi:hypothetical protein